MNARPSTVASSGTTWAAPKGAQEVAKYQAFRVSEDQWVASFERLVPELKRLCQEFHREELVLSAGLLDSAERALLESMSPQEQYRYLLSARMREKAQMTELSSLRHSRAMQIINEIV